MEIELIQKIDSNKTAKQSEVVKVNNKVHKSMQTKNLKTKGLESVFELYNIMHRNQLNYVYRGIFTRDITKKILALVEFNLVHEEESRIIKKKIFNLMVEGLQNITRHQADDKNKTDNNYGVFAIKRESYKYLLTTGNLIKNEIIDELSSKIEAVNKLDKEGLKKYYRAVLRDGEISDKGGAGLGLIDMARKSGNKLLYSFEKINENFSYFYLHLEIVSQKSEKTHQEVERKRKLNEYTQLHKILTKENLIFSFNNSFNDQSMMNLLSLIESQINNNVRLKKRVYNVMVEMFQNIIKHGDNYENIDDDKDGLFYISENSGNYLLNTGNYIKNEKINKLKKKIDLVNNLPSDDLEDYYDKMLFDFDIDTNKEAGLGLIDLRIRTDSKLEYDFLNVDDDFSFYTLRASIAK